VDPALVIVDLSNLCRDRRFLPVDRKADLSLLDRFVTGLPGVGLGGARLRAVADRSLVPLLSAGDRRGLASLQTAGVVELSALADERILEQAFGEGGNPGTLVASMDNFDDFRRSYPAIQGSTDRFLGWDVSGDGALVVVRRDMGVHEHQRLSRKEESSELLRRRLRRATLVRQATGYDYRCENAECLLVQLWPDRLPDLPRYDDTQDCFVCPGCLQPLVQGELRANAAQMIVYLDGVEQFRFLIEEGDQVALGRKDAKGCIGLQARLRRQASSAVSRRHVAFRFADSSVHAEDLTSRNGTVVRRGGREHRMAPGTLEAVGPRTTVVLPGGITIERSGRSFPLDGERAPETGPDEPDQTTRLLIRPMGQEAR
jgi:FHA domain